MLECDEVAHRRKINIVLGYIYTFGYSQTPNYHLRFNFLAAFFCHLVLLFLFFLIFSYLFHAFQNLFLLVILLIFFELTKSLFSGNWVFGSTCKTK